MILEPERARALKEIWEDPLEEVRAEEHEMDSVDRVEEVRAAGGAGKDEELADLLKKMKGEERG